MLKQIPQETPPLKMKTKGKEKNPSSQKTKPIMQLALNPENPLIHLTFIKLFHYLKRTEKYGATEMEDLIHSLQRSILNLQKKRHILLRKSKKEKKTK